MPARTTTRLAAGALAALMLTATATAALQPDVASAAGHVKKKADLTVTTISGVPSAVSRTAPMPLKATVRNRGKAKAKGAEVTFWWSVDTKAGGDTLLATAEAPGLKAGRSADVTATVAVPANVSGAGYVLACGSSRKDASARNDCKTSAPTSVSAPVTTPPNQPPAQEPPVQQAPGATFSGELRGDLHFVDQASKSEGSVTDVWDIRADVSVNATVNGPAANPTDAVVASTTSSYVLAGKRRHHSSYPADCPSTTEEVSQGSGRFPWTGDPYKDGLRTGIATTDMSELSMVIEMPYSHTTTDKSCRYDTTRTAPARAIIVLEFVQVARTAKSVRYAVSTYHDVDDVTSEFETLTGQLELSLD
jgi:hypothetical protein